MHHEDSKTVHPFFSKATKTPQETAADNAATIHDNANDDDDYNVQGNGLKASKPRKKRAKKPTNQPSLDNFARRPFQCAEVDMRAAGDERVESTLDEDLNLERRKRRKTVSPEPTINAIDAGQPTADSGQDLYQQLQAEAGGTQEVIDDIMVDTLVVRTPKEEVLKSSPPVTEALQGEFVPESSLPPATADQPRSVTPPTAGGAVEGTKVTPKKQIKVTKTGKLVSSPPKKPEPPASTTPKRRGRPRKVAKNKNLSATITVIKYGSDKLSRLALGQKIEAILNGGTASVQQDPIVPPKRAGPAKPAHPFFTGKAGQKKDQTASKREEERRPVAHRTSACTPGKLWAERRKEQDDEDVPAFGMSSKNSRSAKQSGLHEPLWPSRDTAHVRNIDPVSANVRISRPPERSPALTPAKMKQNANTIPVEEEIITRLADQLSSDMRFRPDSTDLAFAPPEDVRLPTRLLTTGIDIQNKVRAEIRAPIETLAQRIYAKTHPAITALYDEIEHTLTPFDEGRCEPQAWAQKYRPLRADRVLQAGKEPFALRDWLESLTVMAVGVAQDPSKGGSSMDTRKPPKKKRKTAADDFIVFSDEEDEDEEMIDLGPDNTATHPSIRRPRWTRNKNVVLLSGPQGCGKSATVYAVAKELDFEVFELHSGVRRSGKDIQDKVGDMTANHLVNHQRGDAPTKPKPALAAADNDTDTERDKAFQEDLDSGRQGTMTSFFAAKPALKTTTKPKPKVQVVVKSPTKARSIPAAQAMLPIASASRKSQKQSLILIEEADILFEEDQNFWAYIIKLAAQSKRPIVITCNNELQIPTQALPMAAILRLTPPPVELATDYLVALAGREGHILQRQAIDDLYKSKNHDLRASITELNFWCQMSVGDKKGGLEWTYQRWPPGKDVDAKGRLLRVASEDTYRSGMGWLSHNVFESKNNAVFTREEELLTEVWNDWGISPTSWDVDSQPNCARVDANVHATQQLRLNELERLSAFSDAFSASDVYARVDLPGYETQHDQPMDPTLPSMTDKERLSYTIDAPLVQVSPLTDFSSLDTSLSTTTHMLTTRMFPDFAAARVPAHSRSATLEQTYTLQILAHKAHITSHKPLTRTAFTALDILATPSSPFATSHDPEARSSYNLQATSLDRPFSILTLDIAPYVRSIVAHEQDLESQRIRLGSLLSEGGGRAKRVRTTKASRTAMEGGERQSKRRARWFHRELSFELVMRTAGSWAGMGWKGEGVEEGSVTETQSLGGTQRSTDDQGEMVVDVEAE